VTFSELLDGMRGKTALVVGDVMLDRYVFGRATRVSPEAPVMVVRRLREESLPGGAANVAFNLAAMGLEVHLVGVVGDDAFALGLQECLQGTAVRSHLVTDPSRPTITKTRVLADHAHQVLRIDDESDEEVGDVALDRLADTVLDLAPRSDVLLCSDYQKGIFSEQLGSVIAGISGPKVANAKPESAKLFRNFDVVSMNRAELASFCVQRRGLSDSDVPAAGQSARAEMGCERLMITLGESGLVVIDDRSCLSFPARKVEVYDTAGAGDTVIATVAAGWTVAPGASEVFRLAIETSARVVQRVGVAAPSKEDLDFIRGLD
jgi:D-beta-D-heptose 7-phosphate kinase/D-beta-D-heptose 1-phosphate adenosyltransferase